MIMHRYILGLAMGLFFLASSMAFAEQSSIGVSGSLQSGFRDHEYLTGNVDKITDGAVFLKTDEGALREFSLKEVKQEKIKGLAVGDRLQLEINEGDQIIDIGRVRPGGLERNERVRVVEGKIERYDPLKKLLTFKHGDGTSRIYHLKDAAATRMNDVKTGGRVTLELDLKNNMVEDFK
jgi:hypothetical protein